MIQVVPTTKVHTVRLGCWMRPADVAECRALGLGAIEAAYESWKASDYCSTLLVGGEVAAVGGLVLDEGETALGARRAQAWLLTSKLVDAYPMALHRTAKAWLAQAEQKAGVLWNHVDARYESSLRWLARLGFVVHPARPHGPLELPFHLVTRESR